MKNCWPLIAVLVVVVLIVVMRGGVESLNTVAPGAITSTYTNYLDGNKIHVFLHSTSWCGYCRQARPVWDRLKTELAGQNIKFVEIDEDKEKTPWVEGYPTIARVKDGIAHIFNGRASDYTQVREFILNASNTSTR